MSLDDVRHLYLMRHAEAELDTDQEKGHLFSTGDTPLSARGREQASTMASLLADQGIDAVLASPAQRARETAELIAAPLGLEVRTDPGLAEVPFAPPGVDYATLLKRIQRFANDLRRDNDPVLAGDRRYSTVKARFQTAITRVLEHHERPLVVAHGAINRVYLADLLGMAPHALFRLEQDHACVNVVAFDDKRRTVLKLNVTVPPLATAASSMVGL